MITTDLELDRPPHGALTVEGLTPSAGMLLKNCGIRLAGRVAVGLQRTLGSRAAGGWASSPITAFAPTSPGCRRRCATSRRIAFANISKRCWTRASSSGR